MFRGRFQSYVMTCMPWSARHGRCSGSIFLPHLVRKAVFVFSAVFVISSFISGLRSLESQSIKNAFGDGTFSCHIQIYHNIILVKHTTWGNTMAQDTFDEIRKMLMETR